MECTSWSYLHILPFFTAWRCWWSWKCSFYWLSWSSWKVPLQTILWWYSRSP
jgi:hypothetical protein